MDGDGWMLEVPDGGVTGLVPPEAALPGMWPAGFSPCPHVVDPPRVCVLTSSSYHDPRQTRSGPTLLTSFYFYHLFKNLVSIYSHVLRSWG